MNDAPTSGESPGGVEVAPGIWAPASALHFQFARSSGPGGQNVNKLNTKAELWVAIADLRGLDVGAIERLRRLAGHRLTREDQIHIVADTARTQESNRAAVMYKFRELLVEAIRRPRRRRKTRPSAASRQRRLEAKKQRSQIKAARRAPDHGP